MPLSLDPQRVRERVSFGVDPNTPFRLGIPTLTVANRDPAVGQDDARRSPAVGDLRRSCGSRASGAGVNHRSLRVAFYRRWWLPKGYSSANSGKREQSPFPVPSRHVSVRRSACLGSSPNANANFWGLWLTGRHWLVPLQRAAANLVQTRRREPVRCWSVPPRIVRRKPAVAVPRTPFRSTAEFLDRTGSVGIFRWPRILRMSDWERNFR